MSKYRITNLACNISIGTIITALTVDHWYVIGAIIGILSTLAAMVSDIYFSRKADQRAEAQFKQIMSGR
jgi:hypothetical protein